MAVFPSMDGEPNLGKVFRLFPKTLAPLLEYHDRLLRDPGPLRVADRELIAAYVSGLNACTYCHGAHVVAAQAFGIDPDLFEGLMADPLTSAVDERLKPILVYVGKLTRTPALMSDRDAEPVWAAGWSEEALFDAVSICALFNLMNRIIEGSGIKSDPLAEDAGQRQARLARMGGAGSDPYAAPRSYTRLATLWGIETT